MNEDYRFMLGQGGKNQDSPRLWSPALNAREWIKARASAVAALLSVTRRPGDANRALLLQMLHAVHDAMTSCLRDTEVDLARRCSLAVESPALFDSDLASMACFIVAKFPPAIVTELDGEEVSRASARLADLFARLRTRTATIKLH